MHHSFVATGLRLARSVCVIQPYSPFVGTWRRTLKREDLREDFRADDFVDAFLGLRVLFAIV